MNNTIFRRKLGLGVLIALVLAFGVHGVADAVLTVSKVSGDYQHKIYTQNFDFRFRISGVDTTDQVNDSIQIVVSAGSIRVGSEAPTTGTTITLTEGHTNTDLTDGTGRLTNGIISVRCKPTEADSFTVTVNPVNPSTGFTDLRFTAYGIRRPEDIGDAQVFHTTIGNPKTEIEFDSPPNKYSADPTVAVTLDGTGSDWVYVDFSVNGPGLLYQDLDGNGRPDAPPQNRLQSFTNGAAPPVASVKLQMRGGTNKVTASIKDTTDKTHVITYFYQSVQLNRVSGNGQVGRPTTQLEEPIVVEVTDSRGNAISGQEVEFTATATAPVTAGNTCWY